VGHDHEHDHHGHDHGSSRAENRRRLGIVLGLTGVYMLAEVVGGLLSNSLALLADAGHMLSDVGALGLSIFAIWVAQRPANPKRTYGYYRVEILAALVHAAALLAIAVFITTEAVERFSRPPEVRAPIMLAVAVGGLIVNLIGLMILRAGKKENVNVRGAWLHVMTDALGSVGAILSAAAVWAFDFRLADPLASMVISALVVYSSWPLLKQTVAILMESAPGHIDVDLVRDAMAATPGVREVHDLHVWTITQGLECLSGHVVTESQENQQELLATLRHTLHERFGIDHVTIQIELVGCEEDHVCS
jgi:cobalt-zinc-cadmium efflux system protein